MSTEELLAAALKLSEQDRVMLATRLLESVPESNELLWEGTPGFFEELEQRASDQTEAIPAEDLWKSR